MSGPGKKLKLALLLFALPSAIFSHQIGFCSPSLEVENGDDTSTFLKRLYHNPRQVMEEAPPKWDLSGQRVHNEIFRESEVSNNNFVLKKVIIKNKLIGDSHGLSSKFSDETYLYQTLIDSDEIFSDSNFLFPLASYLENDRPEKLVDNGPELVRNIFDMEEAQLLWASLPEQPWSDSYWPTRYGLLANRYGDPSFPQRGSWESFYQSYLTKQPQNFVEDQKIHLLSPAEKYDLVTGSQNFDMTKTMWAHGKKYVDTFGDVEIWMGLCHGWAAASYMLPRPRKAIKIKSFDGQHDITFYPADIRALGTLLWANSPGTSRFIGSRCYERNPARDVNGRIIKQQCFDTNPATWHLALVNQIGVSKRSFIFDSTYDYEVWNQPVVRYSYKYFNPQTGKVHYNAQDAIIPLENFERDLFKQYRSTEAKNIIGIEMEVVYSFENNPQHRLVESSQSDILQKTRYRYDLELDANGNILGGEWYSNKHPDFLYTPVKGSAAGSFYDRQLNGEWDPTDSIPTEWSEIAQRASRREYPLAKIVEVLFRLSSQQ